MSLKLSNKQREFLSAAAEREDGQEQRALAILIFFEAKENVDRDLFCRGSNKVGTADIPWTGMHGSHMHGLWWRAIRFNKNVVFIGVTVRESCIQPASQEFVHHQSRPRPACWNARPALSLGFALRNRAHNPNSTASSLTTARHRLLLNFSGRARACSPRRGEAKRKSDQCFALASHRGSRSGEQPAAAR